MGFISFCFQIRLTLLSEWSVEIEGIKSQKLVPKECRKGTYFSSPTHRIFYVYGGGDPTVHYRQDQPGPARNSRQMLKKTDNVGCSVSNKPYYTAAVLVQPCRLVQASSCANKHMTPMPDEPRTHHAANAIILALHLLSLTRCQIHYPFKE